MSVKEERMSDADDKVYLTHTIKIEPISPQREDQFSCTLIKVEKDSEDDTDVVSTHDGCEYILELELKKEEPCETPKVEPGVSNAELEYKHYTDGPTVIQPQYIGSSLHTTDASKAELIQCGGADVALDTTTPGAASYHGHSTGSGSVVVHGGTTDHIEKKDKGIIKGDNVSTRVVEEKLFSCSICQNKFTAKASLVPHMRTHTGEKPFSCNVCEYKCKVKSSLVTHMRTHSREKPFTCHICEYKCSIKSSLLVHMRIHTGEKPFSCNICQYKCTIRSSLVTHMRTHTGEKPFSCHICEYKSKVKSGLIKHLLIHTGNKQFSCNICKYKCSVKSYLVRHMRVHTGEN